MNQPIFHSKSMQPLPGYRWALSKYWLCLLLSLALLAPYSMVLAQANITKAEYFFDDDPGFGSGVNIALLAGEQTPVVGNKSFNADISALTTGVHQLFIRVKDANGNWSISSRTFFYKAPIMASGALPNVVSAEYFFDDDPGFGSGSNISGITAGTTVLGKSFNANITSLAAGVHQLFVRAKDANGSWSIANRTFFYKPPFSATGSLPNITGAEYFFDDDPGFGSGNAIAGITAGTTVLDKSFTANISSLAAGVHQLFVRARDANGTWGICNRTFFYKASVSASGSLPNITSAEYFFDNDPGFGSGNNIAGITAGTTVLDKQFNADISSLATGVHQLFVRAKDANKTWSISNRTFFYKPAADALSTPPNMVAAEYFIDNDPGFDKAIPYPFSAVGALSAAPIQVNVSGLSDGTHKFYLRIKDALGKWSITNVSPFNVTNAAAASTIVITGIEKLTLCASETIGVGYHINGTFINGNQFIAELSDKNGSFAAAQTIGTKTDTISGLITCTVPAGLPQGTNYLIRIRSTNPAITGAVFSQALATSCLNETDPVVNLVSKQDVSCFGDLTGLVDITVSGGNTPYTFAWTKTGVPAFSASTEDLQNLSAGTYNLILTTAGSKSANFSVSISQPAAALSVGITPVNAGCAGQTNGSAVAATTGGTAPYTYKWLNGPASATYSSLGAGTYNVTATDSKGCTATAQVTITQSTGIVVSASQTIHPTCTGSANGSITVSVTGGNSPYTYAWNNGTTTATISNLAAGNYTVTAKDASGCTAQLSVTLTAQSTAPIATVTPGGSTALCQGQTVILNASNGSSWLWSNGATTQAITVSLAGTYSVTVTNAGGCSASSAGTTVTVTSAPVWYIDADGDKYGTGATQQACTRPANGFTAAELTATTGDCDDNNANINPGKQYFAFTGNQGYTDKVINTVTGSSYTVFRFEVDYFDATGALPPSGYPRVLLDYEGNGSLADINDRTIVMLPADASDNNTVDGKRYIATINGLTYGSNYKTSIKIGDVNNCGPALGSFNYPDVLQEPNLSIFASDITFSKRRPDPGEAITVTAIVRNESDYAAQSFIVKLINQNSPGIIYPDQTVNYIAPHSTANVVWNITTPPVPSWNPMQVIVDYTNAIAENNEQDNNAVRPFVNGNYPVPGNITITAPPAGTVCNYPNTSVTITGKAIYTDVAVPLPDPSVAGATVDITVAETGATYSAFTNSLGEFSISFYAPLLPGNFHVSGVITDFTLEGNFTTQFNVINCAPPPVCTLPDLGVSISADKTTVVQGNSINANITVKNNGQTATTNSTIVALSQTGGTAFANSQITIPPLAAGQSYTVSIGSVTFATPGYFYLYADADATKLETECNESNITSLGITVLPNLPDIIPVYGPIGQAYNCPNPGTPFTLYNAGGVAAGAFTAEVEVLFGGIVVGTYQHSVPGIGVHQYYGFSAPHNYTQYGTYSYTIKADIPTATGGVIAELSETNNEAAYNNSFTLLACKPNFTLTACPGSIVAPVDPQTPGTLTLSIVLNNNGNAAASGSQQVRFAYSDGSFYTGTHTGTLDVGASTVVSVTAPSPASGTTLTITADPANAVDELNENDNTYSNKMCYDVKPVPACGGSTFSGPVNINHAATPWVAVTQKYLYLASVVKVKFEISGPGITGTQLLGYVNMNNPPSSCFCPGIVSLPNSYVFGQVGTYTFTFTLDPDNVLNECDETDNVMQTQIVVSNQPDLRVISQFINPTKLNPNPGEAVTFAVTYENIGSGNVNDAMKFKVQVDGTDLQQVDVTGLATGDKNTVNFTVPWSSTINGAHVVRAIIDAQNQVTESNELNNEATRAIVVGPSTNLYFEYVTSTSTLTPAVGQIINLQAKVLNGGAQACNSFVQFYYKDLAGNWVQITDPVLGSAVAFNIDGNGSAIVNFPWQVTTANATIEARIVNTSVLEYNYDDNIMDFSLGGFIVTVSNTVLNCSGNGILVSSATGGTGPYFYRWSNGQIGDTLKATSGNYTVTVTDAVGVQRSVTGTVCKGVLPVTWLGVSARLAQGKVIIDWATASENNTASFTVEHSMDGLHYTPLKTLPAAGNSSSIHKYQFIHVSPLAGINYYRIRQTDNDGRYVYSSIVLIKVEAANALRVFPNPAQQSVMVTGLQANGNIEIMSADGKLVKKFITTGNSMSIDLGKFTSGIYILSYQNKGILQQQKIMKE